MTPHHNISSGHTQSLRRAGLTVLPECDLRVLAAVMDADAPPSIRDLCERFGVNMNSIQPPLARLTEAGLVTRKERLSRTARACCRFLAPDELEAAAWMVEEVER